MSKLSVIEAKQRFAALSPEIPWAHHFELAPGVHTIEPENEKFYKKSIGLAKVADVILELIPYHTKHATTKGLRVLDVACGEGAHSIRLGQLGASVIGIEGRELYVSRARLAAEALEVEDLVRFDMGDVREIDVETYGQFDLVIVSGILHHLNSEVFFPFLESIGKLCGDTMILYTHISTDVSTAKHRLTGPVMAQNNFEGYLYREHEDNATDEERKTQVRASLDNTHSFWPTENSLILALEKAGFPQVFRSLRPHIFGNWDNAAYRPMIVARK